MNRPLRLAMPAVVPHLYLTVVLVIFAEGAAAETFQGSRSNRQSFDNADEYERMYADAGRRLGLVTFAVAMVADWAYATLERLNTARPKRTSRSFLVGPFANC